MQTREKYPSCEMGNSSTSQIIKQTQKSTPPPLPARRRVAKIATPIVKVPNLDLVTTFHASTISSETKPDTANMTALLKVDEYGLCESDYKTTEMYKAAKARARDASPLERAQGLDIRLEEFKGDQFNGYGSILTRRKISNEINAGQRSVVNINANNTFSTGNMVGTRLEKTVTSEVKFVQEVSCASRLLSFITCGKCGSDEKTAYEYKTLEEAPQNQTMR